MRRFALLMAASFMLAFQQEDPPPEPPDNVEPCYNHHDDSAKNCMCPMGSPGEGSHDTRPDPAKGEHWCMTYCKKGKCGCLKPMKTVMPWEQAHR